MRAPPRMTRTVTGFRIFIFLVTVAREWSKGRGVFGEGGWLGPGFVDLNEKAPAPIRRRGFVSSGGSRSVMPGS
ncbi:putative uncharacterized protein [Desulfovibrio ferrophilus]|uniref:Uncharacterized protein n=1 Tax=Desulfovibrio ferrophilus TaxID=241368 RepID=A0A2Z6AZE0_9BACT|nr:putative uncharacterized protein [Desulfovibrio ferrophilus]